jgi:hypothetical protein
MEWVGHIARPDEVYMWCWWGKMREKHLEKHTINGTILFKWYFRKLDVGARTESILLRIGTVGGHL